MKYYLYTAQAQIGYEAKVVNATLSTDQVFFTKQDLNESLNFYDEGVLVNWCILFLKELTKEEYEYYNK